MGSRLLNGSPQLSVMVTMFPLILIELSSTVTPGTIVGTPVIYYILASTYICTYFMYVSKQSLYIYIMVSYVLSIHFAKLYVPEPTKTNHLVS